MLNYETDTRLIKNSNLLSQIHKVAGTISCQYDLWLIEFGTVWYCLNWKKIIHVFILILYK